MNAITIDRLDRTTLIKQAVSEGYDVSDIAAVFGLDESTIQLIVGYMVYPLGC